MLSCVVSCAYVYAHVYDVSMCTLQIYVFIILVRLDGGAGPRVSAKLMAVCQQQKLTFEATRAKHCILSVQNANFFTQDMSDPMFAKSGHVRHK